MVAASKEGGSRLGMCKVGPNDAPVLVESYALVCIYEVCMKTLFNTPR